VQSIESSLAAKPGKTAALTPARNFEWAWCAIE
jgi:hypothetical protein